MSLTSQSIRNALEIKDPNITFLEDSHIQLIKGKESLVYPASLTYKPDHCANCGFADKIVKYGTQKVRIIAPSAGFRPAYILLKRQRYRCEACLTTFSAHSPYVWQNCQISQPVRQMILSEAMTNISLKDIARRYFVSDKTVQRIVDAEAKQHHNYQTQWLPPHMAFDEFKSTDKMSFIWCDSTSHTLGEILALRTSRTLKEYFESFPLEVRQTVNTISVDLNAGYVNLIPKLFPNAEIVIDRFHIIQMVNRAVNQIRVQTMKTLDHRSKKYKFMKQEWKQFLRPMEKLEKVNPRYHSSVGYYQTDYNLVMECLDLDDHFRIAYDTYQGLLKSLQNHDTSGFEKELRAYHQLENAMDTPIASLKKHRKAVLNAVESPYSNGFLEGMISRIKKIKNTAYGYRNWRHFIDRIKLELAWYQTKDIATAA